MENNQNEMKCLSDMSILREFQCQIPEQLKGQKAKIFTKCQKSTSSKLCFQRPDHPDHQN